MRRGTEPSVDATLLSRYDSARGRAAELAAELGIPTWTVRRRAAELGLTRARDRYQPWSAEDVAHLVGSLGKVRIGRIARAIGRSTSSVAMKVKRLGLSRRVRDAYSCRQISVGLGVDHRTVVQWISAGKLRAAPPSPPERSWRIQERDLLRFVVVHPGEISLRRVDETFFLGVILRGARAQLTGERPRCSVCERAVSGETSGAVIDTRPSGRSGRLEDFLLCPRCASLLAASRGTDVLYPSAPYSPRTTMEATSG